MNCLMTAWHEHEAGLRGWLRHRIGNAVDAEDLRELMSYGVISTPGVVIDGKVVHAGDMPSRAKIEQWLAAGQA